MLKYDRKSQCKRDALPTELTARTSEMAGFSPFLNPVTLAKTEPSGNEWTGEDQ